MEWYHPTVCVRQYKRESLAHPPNQQLFGETCPGRHSSSMRKLKLALFLPMVQVVIAIFLLEWGYRAPSPFPRGGDELYIPTEHMICHGINAPAWQLSFLVELIPIPDVTLFHLYKGDFAFLGCVVVVWYLVGRMLDRRILHQTSAPAGTTPGKSLLNFFLVILGGWFLYSSIEALRLPGRWNNYTGNIAEGILFLAWSFVLILIPGRMLMKTLRNKSGVSETAA